MNSINWEASISKVNMNKIVLKTTTCSNLTFCQVIIWVDSDTNLYRNVLKICFTQWNGICSIMWAPFNLWKLNLIQSLHSETKHIVCHVIQTSPHSLKTVDQLKMFWVSDSFTALWVMPINYWIGKGSAYLSDFSHGNQIFGTRPLFIFPLVTILTCLMLFEKIAFWFFCMTSNYVNIYSC